MSTVTYYQMKQIQDQLVSHWLAENDKHMFSYQSDEFNFLRKGWFPISTMQQI